MERIVGISAAADVLSVLKRIGVEDLNVRGMAKNRCLAGSIMDGGFFEFRRQLDYKARLYGAAVVVADRWYPSSKTCSCCGSVKAALDLSQRVFRCEHCGFVADRDWNAAKNLERLAASSAVSACGEERSGAARKSRRETGLEEAGTERHWRALHSLAQLCVGFGERQMCYWSERGLPARLILRKSRREARTAGGGPCCTYRGVFALPFNGRCPWRSLPH